MLQENLINLNLEKCEIKMQSLVYLGFMVSGGELKIASPKKTVSTKERLQKLDVGGSSIFESVNRINF